RLYRRCLAALRSDDRDLYRGSRSRARRPATRRAGVRHSRRLAAMARRGQCPAAAAARRRRADWQAPASAPRCPQSPLCRKGGDDMSALVSLVGAGPGDADLLTLKAVKRLSEADLVLYDGLVDPDVLKLVGKARRFYVGKRAGRKAIEQETINHLMIRAARRGERVVRLKCGDPFVLGRGGEEALALAEAGIPFEGVPGIRADVAAPPLPGIPGPPAARRHPGDALGNCLGIPGRFRTL